MAKISKGAQLNRMSKYPWQRWTQSQSETARAVHINPPEYTCPCDFTTNEFQRGATGFQRKGKCGNHERTEAITQLQ